MSWAAPVKAMARGTPSTGTPPHTGAG